MPRHVKIGIIFSSEAVSRCVEIPSISANSDISSSQMSDQPQYGTDTLPELDLVSQMHRRHYDPAGSELTSTGQARMEHELWREPHHRPFLLSSAKSTGDVTAKAFLSPFLLPKSRGCYWLASRKSNARGMNTCSAESVLVSTEASN